MIDFRSLIARQRAASALTKRLRESLEKCERELKAWDAYDADSKEVKKPLLRREVLEATRDMLLDELRKDAGLPKPS